MNATQLCEVWLGERQCGKPAAWGIPVKTAAGMRLAPVCSDCARRTSTLPVEVAP